MEISRKVLLGFVLLSVIQISWARFVVEKNSLRVTSPEEIKGSYNSAIANFGIPQYGGSLGGTVFYSKNNGQLCNELTDTNFVRHTRGGRPIFFLVDRGDCLFALKVWNAQKAGASAVLVADDVDEHLITMDTPLENSPSAEYEANITIPSALIEKKVGEKLKKSIGDRKLIHVILDWREAVPHPDNRVEYELWTSSNDQCGLKCTMMTNFVKEFKGVAQILERGGYAQFTPHYLTWYCPESFRLSKQCKSQCINHGRYCAPDPEQNFHSGYNGKDVILENLRQLCLFRVANESQKPWLWWDYVTDFQLRCPMKNKVYNKECADAVIKSLGLDVKKIEACMGDHNADANNPVLEQEERAQVGKGSRGDVTIMPTLIVNDRQYRGKFVKKALLKAICAGFKESTEPAVCLTNEVEKNECLVNNGGCWQDKAANITACKDTFRGRICQCPLVDGVQFKGDGYRHCVASGPGRCKINNGGCWQETRNEHSFSACLDDDDDEGGKCQCPPGFKGDGIKSCEDIDECKETKLCQCPGCSCKDTWGGYECSCSHDLLYIREHDTCISMNAVEFWSALMVARVAFIGMAISVVGAYIVYKYRLRSYMNSEIRAIMAQYMPLDGHDEVPNDISQARA